MSLSKNDNNFDKVLVEAFAPPPTADFDAWRQQHSQAVACLNPQRINALAKKRRLLKRIIIFSVTAAVLICAWLGLATFGTDGRGASAFAQVLERIQNAKTMAWKTNIFEHLANKDKEKTWLKIGIQEHIYKAPGLHRDTRLDEKGQVAEVEITDYVLGRKLTYYPKTKKATLTEITPNPDPSGPFVYYQKKLNEPNLQWVGKRKTETGEVNVFRNAFRDHDNGRDWSLDFWIDTKSKKLIEVYQPGADIYDPDKDPARNNTYEEYAWYHTVMGGGERDICYDVALDDSLFRLEPPEGYAVEVKQRDRITEKEMVEYLGILADFNDKTFPDQVPNSYNLLNKINIALHKQAYPKPGEELTAVEKKLLDTDMLYSRRFGTVGNAPVLVFFYWDPDSIVKDSFRYLGKGVKLGDKDRIVCWYKLKNAKDPKTYRVVYGDLNVKDVAPEDLPLPVEP
jgi:outer membrane lipoprotein-sorting protein